MINYHTYQGFKDPEADTSPLYDVRGTRKTQLLFHEKIEPSRRKTYTPIYTLKERTYTCPDGLVLPSAYLIYLCSVDETDAALKLVATLGHWRRLLALNWFMSGDPQIGFEGLLQWREDKRILEASKARDVLQRLAYDEGNVTAARTILGEATKGDVGRPRKSRNTSIKQGAKEEEKMVAGIRARLDLNAAQ